MNAGTQTLSEKMRVDAASRYLMIRMKLLHSGQKMKNTIGLKDTSAAFHTTFKTIIVSMGLKLVLRCFFQGDTKMKIQCTMHNALNTIL